MVHGMPNVRRLGMRVQNMVLLNKGLVCNKEIEFKYNLGGILVISSFIKCAIQYLHMGHVLVLELISLDIQGTNYQKKFYIFTCLET